jgi:hypothetical protein
MNITQHTPGPWIAKVVSWNTGFKIVDTSEKSIAAYSSAGSRPQDESAANAKLIALAPELLTALAKLLSDVTNNSISLPSSMNSAAAVIAKFGSK